MAKLEEHDSHGSHASNEVESTHLGLAQLEECDESGIVTALKKLIVTKNLNINNCIAMGTDNASAMVEINNGSYSRLKQENTLILLRCVCHSIQLATSYASTECLPSNLEYLISESHYWFAKSSVRQYQYNELYKAINDGSQPMKIPSHYKARWLPIQPAVENTIAQCLEIKAHSKMDRLSENCYTVELLFEMYPDERKLSFLLFCNQS